MLTPKPRSFQMHPGPCPCSCGRTEPELGQYCGGLAQDVAVSSVTTIICLQSHNCEEAGPGMRWMMPTAANQPMSASSRLSRLGLTGLSFPGLEAGFSGEYITALIQGNFARRIGSMDIKMKSGTGLKLRGPGARVAADRRWNKRSLLSSNILARYR